MMSASRFWDGFRTSHQFLNSTTHWSHLRFCGDSFGRARAATPADALGHLVAPVLFELYGHLELLFHRLPAALEPLLLRSVHACARAAPRVMGALADERDAGAPRGATWS